MSTQDIEDYLYWCADRYLSYRPRTEFELRRYLTQKLKQKKITDEDAQKKFLIKILHRLTEEDRLDDKKFIELFVDDRQYFRPRGKRRLIDELTQKGISKDLIETYFSNHEIVELPIITEILNKKLRHFEEIDPTLRQKIINHLLRRGFSYSNIKLAIEEFIKKK